MDIEEQKRIVKSRYYYRCQDRSIDINGRASPIIQSSFNNSRVEPKSINLTLFIIP